MEFVEGFNSPQKEKGPGNVGLKGIIKNSQASPAPHAASGFGGVSFKNLSTENSEARSELDRLKKEIKVLKNNQVKVRDKHERDLVALKAQLKDESSLEIEIEKSKAEKAKEDELTARFEKEKEETFGSFKKIIEAFENERKEYFHITEDGVSALVGTMCRRIVGEWIDHHPEAIENSVKEALSYLGNEKELILLLNPVDLTWVQAHYKEWLPLSSIDLKVRLEADERIERGGCMLETESGSVDVRVEQMLDGLESFIHEQFEMAENENGKEGNQIA